MDELNTENKAAAGFCRFCGKELVIVDNKCSACGKEYLSAVSYAGFWLRFVAIVLDQLSILIIFAVIGVMGTIALAAIVAPESRGVTQIVLSIAMNIVSTITAWLYFAFMESSKYQGTLGKIILGIKVTDINGQKVTFLRATGRHFGKIISAIIFLGGFIMAGFTEKKQALHDIMAGCLVVKRA